MSRLDFPTIDTMSLEDATRRRQDQTLRASTISNCRLVIPEA